MPNFILAGSNFQYKFDEKTGLSATYDAAKMSIEEVTFKFREYKFVIVNGPVAKDEQKQDEIYVQYSDSGLAISLKDTEGNPVPAYCLTFDELELNKSDFVLTEDAFDKKHSKNPKAKTLKENIINDLFSKGHVIKPFNLKIYKITPKDTNEKPFLLALNHAKSGTQKKDAPPRVKERKEINRISTVLQEQHPECTHFVWAGDSNEPAYAFIDESTAAADKEINGADLKVNEDGLTNESAQIAGANLVAVKIALPDPIRKARVVGVRTNPQTDKGGEIGNAELSAKARVMVFEFQIPDETNKDANAKATARILKNDKSVPKGKVPSLPEVETGSDHRKTPAVQVNSIILDAAPLLETSGPRGFHSYEGIYKNPYDDASIKIEQASGLKLAECILLEMGKTPEEIKKMNFMAREKVIHAKPNTLINAITVDWKKDPTELKIYKALKTWITSDEQINANKLLAKTPELASESDIEKIFNEYLKKKDGRIMDAVFRTEDVQLSGGFKYLPNPRRAQLASYDSMATEKVDLRISAGDGPGNHYNYEVDMLKVCARLNSLNAGPRYFINTALGIAAGPFLGTAAALAIGLAAPLVIGLALGSAAVLGLIGLAYATYKYAQATQPIVPEVSDADTSISAAPSQTVGSSRPQPALETKPAPIVFSRAPESANASATESATSARRPSQPAAA